MAATLSLGFFIYTILLMLVCAYASSAALCSYLVTMAGRTSRRPSCSQPTCSSRA